MGSRGTGPCGRGGRLCAPESGPLQRHGVTLCSVASGRGLRGPLVYSEVSWLESCPLALGSNLPRPCYSLSCPLSVRPPAAVAPASDRTPQGGPYSLAWQNPPLQNWGGGGGTCADSDPTSVPHGPCGHGQATVSLPMRQVALLRLFVESSQSQGPASPRTGSGLRAPEAGAEAVSAGARSCSLVPRRQLCCACPR